MCKGVPGAEDRAMDRALDNLYANYRDEEADGLRGDPDYTRGSDLTASYAERLNALLRRIRALEKGRDVADNITG